MSSTLYYRVLTEHDYCPECKGILTHGVYREKDQSVHSICFNCGYGYETFDWPSKKKDEREVEDES